MHSFLRSSILNWTKVVGPSSLDDQLDLRITSSAHFKGGPDTEKIRALVQARELVELLPVAVCFVSEGGNIEYGNTNFLKNVYTHGACNIMSAISEEDNDRFFLTMQRVFAGGEVCAIEGSFLTNVAAEGGRNFRRWSFAQSVLGVAVITIQPESSDDTIEQLIEARYEKYSENLINDQFRKSIGLPKTETGSKPWDTFLQSVEAKTRRMVGELKEARQNEKIAEDRLEDKRTFVRYMSHEIRTPLNVVMSGLQLLSRVTRSDEDAEMMLETISACEFALGMMDDLLAYERIESDSFGAAKERVDLNALVYASVAQYHLQARCSSVHLSLEITALTSIIVYADSAKISQVIRNLLHNAIKFTPVEGTVTVRLSLPSASASASTKASSDASVQWARIEVLDSGPGIDPVYRSKLFGDTGIQFSLSKLQQGAGLGLFLSQNIIVGLHEGRIGVDQTRPCSEGSLFFFELPVLEVVPLPALSRGISASMSVFSGCGDLQAMLPSLPAQLKSNSNSRLLVVDDVKLCRKFHRRVLDHMFAEVVEAVNGQEAVDKVREAMQSGIPFDGILMDSSMPVLNGVDAVRLIREMRFRGFIAGVTGNAFQADIDEFLASGADEIYIKPVSPEMYLIIVEKITLRLAEC